MWIFYLSLSIIFLLLAFFLAYGYVIFIRTCKRRPDTKTSFEKMFSGKQSYVPYLSRLREDHDWFDESASEQLEIASSDGLKLAATLIKAQTAAKGCIILFHGYRSTVRRDFCMQMRRLHNEGYHLIVTDQRSHGKSEGKWLCFGAKERKDAILWSKKATELFGDDTPIALMGLSMGGATVIMASELAAQNPSVRCVFADCPFDYPFERVSQVIQSSHDIYPFPVMYFVNFWCRLLAGFSLREASATKAARISGLPILIIHGKNDEFVRISHSQRIAVSDNVQLIEIDKADHTEAIYYEEQLYMTQMLEFLNKNMK